MDEPTQREDAKVMMDRYRPRLVVLILPALWLAGCNATQSRKNTAQAGNQSLDPDRAYLALEEIQPPPELPEEAPAPAETERLSTRAARQRQRADKLMAESRFAEANAALERALRYQPSHPAIHAALAALHLKMGNPDVARGHAEKSLESDPRAVAGHYAMGRYHMFHGEYDNALQSLRLALAMMNRQPAGETGPELARNIHSGLADVLSRQGYYTAALTQIEAFNQPVETTDDSDDAAAPDPIEVNRMTELKSDVLRKLGRYAEAAQTIEPLVRSAPGNFKRAESCVRLWLQADDPDRALALAEFLQNESVAPRDEAFALLLEVHREAGRLPQLIDSLRAAYDPTEDDPATAQRLFRAMIEANRFADASGVLAAYLEHHAEADVVRIMLIDAYVEQGDIEGVLTQCSAGIAASPGGRDEYERRVRRIGEDAAAARLLEDDTDAGSDPYLLGLVAREAGRVDRARALFERAYESSPDSPYVRAALAKAFMLEYAYEDALAVARRRDPDRVEDGRLERVLGEIHERLDEDDKAEMHFRAAIQENRDDTDAALALAGVLLKTGQNQRARLHLTNLLERKPTVDEAREMLAKVYFEERKVEATIEQYQKLAETTDSPLVKARCEAALSLRRNGNIEEYRQTMTAAIDEHGADAYSWLALAESYDATELDKARDAYRKAYELAPREERTWKGLLRTLEMLLEFEEAADLQEEMLPRRPNRHAWRFRLLRLLGQTLQQDRMLAVARQEEARPDLDDANRRRYRNIISGTLADMEREDERIATIESWMSRAENDEDKTALLTLYADALLDTGKEQEAVDVLERRFAEDGDDDLVYERLVQTLHQSDRHDRAIQLTLSRLEDDPLSRTRMISLVSSFLRADYIEDALDLLHNQMLQASEREPYQDIRFQVLIASERYREALEYAEGLLDKAVEVMQTLARNGDLGRWNELPPRISMHYPDRPYSQGRLEERIDWLRLLTCDALTGLKEYNEARSRIVGWLEITRHPRVRFLYLRRLRAYQSLLGKSEESSETAERALMMEPEDVGLNNDVAYSWIDKGIRLEEAERRSRYAVFSAPTEGAYLDTYGWLMYKKADFEASYKWLSRAAAFQKSGDAVIYDHLGDACWRLGRKDEAVRNWTTAVENLAERNEEDLDPDGMRVKSQTPLKIEAAASGSQPVVAPTGKSTTGKAVPTAPNESVPSKKTPARNELREKAASQS